MSAKKLGRITAGLFVALGLVFGGSLLADNAGNDVAAISVTGTASVGAPATLIDFEWG